MFLFRSRILLITIWKHLIVFFIIYFYVSCFLWGSNKIFEWTVQVEGWIIGYFISFCVNKATIHSDTHIQKNFYKNLFSLFLSLTRSNYSNECWNNQIHTHRTDINTGTETFVLMHDLHRCKILWNSKKCWEKITKKKFLSFFFHFYLNSLDFWSHNTIT